MIYIESGEKEVVIQFQNRSLGVKYPFTFITNDKYYATLLRRDFQHQLTDRLEAIRRKAYNEGWKDAKSHKAVKKTWFWGSLEL